MPLSAASVLHAFLLLSLLLSATASIPVGDGDVNPSMFTNATGTSPNAVDTERYICYLCTGRNPLLIRYCPIYWDECHLECYDDDASAAATAAIPAASSAPTTTSPGSSAASANPSGGVHDDECYVMKLYQNGSYTIVNRLGCAGIARCLLSCGGGDMAADSDDRKALGTATSAVPATTTAAVQGSLAPRLEDFQRCGTQVTHPPSLRGAVVRAGGAGRRRR